MGLYNKWTAINNIDDRVEHKNGKQFYMRRKWSDIIWQAYLRCYKMDVKYPDKKNLIQHGDEADESGIAWREFEHY